MQFLSGLGLLLHFPHLMNFFTCVYDFVLSLVLLHVCLVLVANLHFKVD